MISVKIEFCSWLVFKQSNSNYFTQQNVYMQVFLSQKLKNRKCYLREVSSALPRAYRRLANDVIRFHLK